MSKMQELIKKYKQNDEKNNLQEIVREIQTCDMLWVAFSPITKGFYIDYVQGSPTVFLFSEKEYCEAYCRHMKSTANSTVTTAECPKDNRLDMFSTFFRCGFESVIIDNGKNFIFLEMEQLVNIPDYSNLPEKERPVFNPAFVCSANRFFQCLENKTITPDKELNLLVETYHAKYLIPIKGEPKDNTVTIPGLERADGSKKVVPFFTDINELRKFDPKGSFNVMSSDFAQIESFCKAGETVVINPMTLNFNLVKETCEAIQKAVAAVPDHKTTKKAVIFNPDQLDPKLIAVLNETLDHTEGAVKGYIKAIRKEKKKNLLVVIDCGEASAEETKNIIDTVKKKASEKIKGIEIEYIPANSDIGRIASSDADPFFEAFTVDFSDDDTIPEE